MLFKGCVQLYAVVCTCMQLCAVVCSCVQLYAVVCSCMQLCAVFSMTVPWACERESRPKCVSLTRNA